MSKRKGNKKRNRRDPLQLGVSTVRRKEGHGSFIQRPAGRSGPVVIIKKGTG